MLVLSLTNIRVKNETIMSAIKTKVLSPILNKWSAVIFPS